MQRIITKIYTKGTCVNVSAVTPPIDHDEKAKKPMIHLDSHFIFFFVRAALPDNPNQGGRGANSETIADDCLGFLFFDISILKVTSGVLTTKTKLA